MVGSKWRLGDAAELHLESIRIRKSFNLIWLRHWKLLRCAASTVRGGTEKLATGSEGRRTNAWEGRRTRVVGLSRGGFEPPYSLADGSRLLQWVASRGSMRSSGYPGLFL